MKKTSLLILLFLLLNSNSQLFSQTTEPKSAFVSINTGGFITAHQDFTKVYSSSFGLTYGAGVGLPLSSRMHLYGKATYFSKTGVPVLYSNTYDSTGAIIKSTETKDGTATFKQWIVNGGLQYDFPLSEDFTVAINGGATYSSIKENRSSLNGTVNGGINGSGILGYFGGLSLEKSFPDSPFAVFAESQYNFSRNDILNFIGNYGGTNLTVGIRYYFKGRRNT